MTPLSLAGACFVLLIGGLLIGMILEFFEIKIPRSANTPYILALLIFAVVCTLSLAYGVLI